MLVEMFTGKSPPLAGCYSLGSSIIGAEVPGEIRGEMIHER
jgi:hypothetical protein